MQTETDVTAVQEPTHIPLRPGFDCAACGEPWPCAPAKVLLSEEYVGHQSSLSMYLSAQMCEALEEAILARAWPKVDNIYDRFLGWTRGGPAVRGIGHNLPPD